MKQLTSHGVIEDPAGCQLYVTTVTTAMDSWYLGRIKACKLSAIENPKESRQS